MTVRDSRTQARARTPGAEDDPTSTTVRDRALGPTQCGISDVATKGHEGRTQTKYLPVYAGSSLKLAMFGKAPSEMSALQPYRGKPAVRNDRGDRGNVGIIEARSAPRSYPTLGLPSFGCAEDSTSARAAAVRKFSSVDVRLGQEATFHTSFAAHRQAQCGMRSNFGIDLTSLTHGCCEQTNICLRGTNSFRWRRAPRRKL